MKPFQIVVAYEFKSKGIGFESKIPWHIKHDLEHFSKLTTEVDKSNRKKNAVIMGRVTYFSIPEKLRPLKSRINIVISKTMKQSEFSEIVILKSLDEAFSYINSNEHVSQAFVIGGQEIYKEALNRCSKIYATEIFIHNNEVNLRNFQFRSRNQRFLNFDRYFTLPENFLPVEGETSKSFNYYEKDLSYRFMEYYRESGIKLEDTQNYFKYTFEWEYLNFLEYVLTNGTDREDRTGTGTISVFGGMMRFDLRNSFPLLTTKRVGWKTVLRELLWFICGQTDNKILQRQNVHIWDKNTSREFLDSRGLHDLKEGDLGAGYSFQWRHFGAEYTGYDENYSGKGFDQIVYVINEIKTNPYSRRIILSAWNPPFLERMALPPCHYAIQFYVNVIPETEKNELSALVNLRSNDLFLGCPFNIASYAFLVYMIASITNLVPGELILSLGDAHVYKNHIDTVKEQLIREPKPFPKLKIKRVPEKIEDFTEDDFEIINYFPYSSIKADMAV